MPKLVDIPGLGVVEFPDDMGDDAISSAIQAQLNPSTPAAPTREPTAIERIATEQPTLAINPYTIAALQGISNLGGGVRQAGAQAIDFLFGTDLKPRVDERVRQLLEEQRTSPISKVPGTGATRFAGEVAPLFALGPITTPLRAAAMGGGIGALSYVPEGESRTEAALKGAAASTIGFYGVRAASSAVSYLTNLLRGRLEPAVQSVVDASKKYGVRLMGTDVAKERHPFLFRRAVSAEQKPLTGVPEFRRLQAEEVKGAAEKLKERYNGDILEDWPQIAQTNLLKRVDRLKAFVGKKYDRLGELADAKGAVPASRTLQTLDDLIANERGRIKPDASLIDELTKLRETIGGKQWNFSALRDFRSDLGLALKGYYRGANTMIGEKGAQIYAQLRRTVDQDMADWAKAQGGDIFDLWKGADATWSRLSSIYRDKQIAAIKDIADPIQLYEKFKALAAHKPQTLYDALGARGQRAIRYGLVREAVKDATRMTPTGEVVSAARLAAQLEKMERQLGILFGKDRAEIEGFIRLMRAAERSGQFMEFPPTGMRTAFSLRNILAGGTIGAGYAVGGIPGAAGVAGAQATLIGLQKVLFTTDAGRRLLLTSAHLDPRGEAIKKLLTQQLPKVIAANATIEDFNQYQRATEPSAELMQALRSMPPGSGVYDPETGKSYALDATGAVRELD